MDDFNQDDINLMMSHVNSYARDKFNGMSPTQLFVKVFEKRCCIYSGIVAFALARLLLSRGKHIIVICEVFLCMQTYWRQS